MKKFKILSRNQMSSIYGSGGNCHCGCGVTISADSPQDCNDGCCEACSHTRPKEFCKSSN